MVTTKRRKKPASAAPLADNQYKGILIALVLGEAQGFNNWRRHCEQHGILIDAELDSVGYLRVSATARSEPDRATAKRRK